MRAPSWIERRRVGLAYSPGGHRTELDRALEGIELADAFHVTFQSGRERRANERTHFVCHPQRSWWRTLVTTVQSLAILLRERPAVMISTGADVAVPAMILGKLLGAKTIFVETAGSLEPTLAGRMVYPFADLFIVQWPEKLERFPKAVLAQGLLL